MSARTETTMPEDAFTFPALPCAYQDFISFVADKPTPEIRSILEQFNQYDAELRQVFAQAPTHPATKLSNLVSVFAGCEGRLKESQRRLDGSPAVVHSLQEFTKSFNVFTESALAELDWTNVVAAGSSVLTPLLPVPYGSTVTKRQLRKYYHEEFAPASDIDLFIYGLTEQDVLVKMRQIEQSVRDAILSETTTIRNAYLIKCRENR